MLKPVVCAVVFTTLALPVAQREAAAFDGAVKENAPVHRESPVTGRGGMSIRLFDCIMPLPPGYILQTNTSPWASVEMYRLDPYGSIQVHEFKPLDPARFEIIGEVRIGYLTVQRVKGRKEYFSSEPIVSYVHDGKTELLITGADQGRAEDMARECIDHPAP